MIDMLSYLDHPVYSSRRAEVVVVATRHEDGSWMGPDSLEYHRQRARLLHSLGDVDGVVVVESSSGLDDEVPQETGFVAIDLGIAVVGTAASVAGVILTWISGRPRKKRDTVPGVRLQAGDATLVIPHTMPIEVQVRLMEAFLTKAMRTGSPG